FHVNVTVSMLSTSPLFSYTTLFRSNLLALASGVCFALFFLLLRHSKARAVNRASSAIYGNLLVVLICAPAFFGAWQRGIGASDLDRKSTRLNSSHRTISYAVFCLNN